MAEIGTKTSRVYVIDEFGFELDPTTPCKARGLLKKGVATITNDKEFTIKLTHVHSQKKYPYIHQRWLKPQEKVFCWDCGKELPRKGLRSSVYRCCECSDKFKQREELVITQYRKLKNELMFNRALNMLSLQARQIKIQSYKEPVQKIKEMCLSSLVSFGSSPEILAAFELERQSLQSEYQYKIIDYSVDILIPAMKVVLEIDGVIYHAQRKKKDKERDIKIREALGLEWEVVHIPAELIQENLRRLVPAIRELQKEMKEQRSKYGGLLRVDFSDRDREYWGIK